MKISIIIPCFNEISTIDKILDKVLAQSKFEKEIIVIDDFSSDGTREYLQNNDKKKIDKLILNEKNFGKGYSLRKGIEVSAGDIILIQDADLEYDPVDYDKIINPILLR
jgi:glycosyltransferase involved in cell wall biosynthesis